MDRDDCAGLVHSLNGHLVLFTGTVHVDGERRTRAEVSRQVVDLGARGALPSGTRNRRVTLLVQGELRTNVVDPERMLSQGAVYVHKQRSRGNHMCIVDEIGLSDLLSGLPAVCLETKDLGDDIIEFSQPAATVPQFRDLPPRRVTTHAPTDLYLDLTGLDRGIAAHERTLEALRAHLNPTPLEGITSPNVDAVWRAGTTAERLFVAEVKSLTGAREDQQIRLGIGQVLDYAHQVREAHPATVREVVPVLVLEHKPRDLRWSDLCVSLGITLTWAPDFPRVRDSR